MKQPIQNKVNKYIQGLYYPEYADNSRSDGIDLRHIKGFSNYKLSQDKKILKRISQIEKVPEENILITAGADYALHHVAETFLTIDKKAVISVPSFPRTEFHVRVVGASPIFINTYGNNEIEKLQMIIQSTEKEKANIIFIESPVNPTGEIIRYKTIKPFLKRNSNKIFIIDQALSGFLDESLSKLALEFHNVIIIKSFSKLYGLAGLRVGYIIASRRLLDFIKKTVSPYEISTESLFILQKLLNKNSVIKNNKSGVLVNLQYLKQNLKIKFSDSFGPFVLLDGGKKLPNLYAQLIKRKTYGVDGKNFRGLENTNTVRISITNFTQIKNIVYKINLLLESLNRNKSI